MRRKIRRAQSGRREVYLENIAFVQKQNDRGVYREKKIKIREEWTKQSTGRREKERKIERKRKRGIKSTMMEEEG